MYNNEFYDNLIKPKITPPRHVFKIVWPILYLIMFISLFIVLKTDSSLTFWAIWSFVLQLLLNLLWSRVFFVFRQIKTALLISLLLNFSVFLMLIIFYKISIVAGLLQVPYFLWLCFASYLNLEFIHLNPFID